MKRNMEQERAHSVPAKSTAAGSPLGATGRRSSWAWTRYFAVSVVFILAVPVPAEVSAHRLYLGTTVVPQGGIRAALSAHLCLVSHRRAGFNDVPYFQEALNRNR
jgi:hypothetical protein